LPLARAPCCSSRAARRRLALAGMPASRLLMFPPQRGGDVVAGDAGIRAPWLACPVYRTVHPWPSACPTPGDRLAPFQHHNRLQALAGTWRRPPVPPLPACAWSRRVRPHAEDQQEPATDQRVLIVSGRSPCHRGRKCASCGPGLVHLVVPRGYPPETTLNSPPPGIRTSAEPLSLG
jgi:hypothetical protein